MTLDFLLEKAGAQGFLQIESHDEKLSYIIDPEDRDRIMLAAERGGSIILTRNQLRAIADEAHEIMEVFA